MYSLKIRIAAQVMEDPVIEYSDHAKIRCIERQISPDDVKSVIKNPESAWIAPNGALIESAVVSGREIKVIFTMKGNSVFVITAEDRDMNRLRRVS
ncbi:MAG: DUF4258 domain-containing protein [Candidatus Marsarchaeota archaeon]|jgi:hypothetical protein|nr:DUF4258 domain-containing protein [Candidatus Marsarchaeota archaeon]MCL5418546.1 DUF4258 domain-containing protein [Candidatus Marsarchaeota archaeon]